MTSKSPRGPLPRFGGPQSKMMYQCMICEKELRRDRLKEHYSSYVDLESLKLTGQERIFAMSRLNYEKRRHTEKVKSIN